ncbi:glutathione S-transferase [Phlebopus sp. FC_14]|nr:glutathione S-transferase [Phlebopus sp. FC_14]
MTLKLYGSDKSTCTRLVALICKEKEIPYEFIPIDLLSGGQKEPFFVEKQPFGQVPYIDDNGFILYESRAIARYLIKKYPSQGTQGLIPTEPQAEALFEQAASIEVHNFNRFASPVVYERLVKRLRGLPIDEAKVAESLAILNAKLDIYELILGKQEYLAGNTVTLADLSHLPHGTLLEPAGYGDLLTSRPNVAKWWNKISSRPAWIALKDGL